jgi:hypothetical protein
VASNNPRARVWIVGRKAQVLADALKLSGEQLISYPGREGIKLADFERRRIALEEDGGGSAATLKRIRKLERELARKVKALAEAAVLLVLKKTIDNYYREEDDDTDEPSKKLLFGRGSTIGRQCSTAARSKMTCWSASVRLS